MKANKTLIVVNEKLYKDKQENERQIEQLRNDFGLKLQILEKENETFKRLLKAEDKLNSVDEILSKSTIEALKTELANQGTMSSDGKMVVDKEDLPLDISEFTQSENDVIQLEMVGTFSDSITVFYSHKIWMVVRYLNLILILIDCYRKKQMPLNYYTYSIFVRHKIITYIIK